MMGDVGRLDQLRAICLALPEVTERPSHGSPAWFVRGKKTIAMYVDDHHGDGILGFWAPAPDGAQRQLIAAEPHRFFVPAYVGHRGWIGVRLDVDTDWTQIEELIEDAYRMVAPKKLIAELDTE
jgi:hypothetical protein